MPTCSRFISGSCVNGCKVCKITDNEPSFPPTEKVVISDKRIKELQQEGMELRKAIENRTAKMFSRG